MRTGFRTKLLFGVALPFVFAACSERTNVPALAGPAGNHAGSAALPPAGANPNAGLIYFGGKFYGATTNGGAHGYGVFFKFTPPSTEVSLHDFNNNGSDGTQPFGAIAHVPAFNIVVGTTQTGGANGLGTVFLQKLTTGGGGGVIHSFTGTDGNGPVSRLIRVGPWVYGTTQNGGTNGHGTIFRVKPNAAGTFTTLYNFLGGTDGVGPYGGLRASEATGFTVRRSLEARPASVPSTKSISTALRTRSSTTFWGERMERAPRQT